MQASNELDATCVNTIRTLSMDAVQAANSGTRGRRWPWRRWPTTCGSTSCASIRRTNHITFGWAKYVGNTGYSIGMRSFGASAPLKDLIKKFGFVPASMSWLPPASSCNWRGQKWGGSYEPD